MRVSVLFRLRLRIALSLAMTLVFVLACDQQSPSGPVEDGFLRLRVAPDQGGSFSMLVDIPSDNLVGFGEQPWTDVIEIVGPAIIDASVYGTIFADLAEYPADYPCSPGPGGTSGNQNVGPHGNGGEFYIVLALHDGISQSNVSTTVEDSVTLRYRGVLNDTRTLRVYRKGGGSVCSIHGGSSFPGYEALNSSQEIAVVTYGISNSAYPLSIYTPDSTAFTVYAEGGYSLASRTWKYRTGDTLAVPAGPPGGPPWNQAVPGCGATDTCSHAPTVSGRFYLLAEVKDGATHIGQLAVASDVIWVNNPHVNLECPSAVVRGEAIACQVNGAPTSTTFNWTFSPDSVRIWPGLGKLTVAGSVELSDGDDSWSGTVVVPGTVVVEVATPFDTLRDSVHVSVGDRNWQTSESVSLLSGDHGEHPVVLSVDTVLLGKNVDPTGDITVQFASSGLDVDTIPSGPNAGYVYLASPPFSFPRRYWVNKWILPSGYIHDVNGDSASHWTALVDQYSGDPQPLFDGVTGHEKYGINGGLGHQQAFKDAMQGWVCGNADAIVDRAAGAQGLVQGFWTAIQGNGGGYLGTESDDAWKVGGNYSGVAAVLGTSGATHDGSHSHEEGLHDNVKGITQAHSTICGGP